MNPSANRNSAYSRWLLLIAGVLAVVFVYSLLSSLHIRSTTGKLDITTNDMNSLLTISRAHSDAALVGTGNAKLRLVPGTYLVTAQHSGRTAQAVVVVKLHSQTRANLQLSQTPALPSPDSISFTGLGALLAKGLTTTQITNLKQQFFDYKPTAKTVVINSSTIQSGPYDPRSDNPAFSLLFSGTVDSQPYTAVLSYTDITNIQLTLSNPQTSQQLYNGNSASNPN